MAKVILNAGHGGSDAGIIYKDRKEKNDNLKLTLAVGEILMENNIEVYYPRMTDEFISPVVRANNSNLVGADLLITIHRGAGPFPNTSSGAAAYIYEEVGINAEAAVIILNNLEKIGFHNNGSSFRDVYLLRYTNIPSFELIVGYINNDHDNELFDTHFDEIALAIADGIMELLIY
ncbi:MAG TPA: N-acetylmuramoyl-L-alanine amidase [Mobilitalea sp.]|nr:N-acetylmuramoyl-L-alanine amidase [Mobilitalea sp.]